MQSPFETALEQIKSNALSSVDLAFRGVGAIGAQGLADALKENKTLTKINLWGNEIGDTGAKDLTNGLKSNYTL